MTEESHINHSMHVSSGASDYDSLHSTYNHRDEFQSSPQIDSMKDLMGPFDSRDMPRQLQHKHSKSNDSNIKRLGLSGLVVLSFYTVCGGPFGVEDIVRAGGPLYSICGFSLIAVWSIPEALITAELSVAMPESSGSVAWVDRAFGEFWAFQKGWLSWLSGVADNALYPILFLDCLLQLLTDDDGNNFLTGDNGTIRWSFIMVITVFLTYLNYRGLEVIGRLATVLCIFSLAPFVVFCAFGSLKVKPSRWLATKPGGLAGVDWRLLLNTFFWNINYWESASSFSADVENPAVNYPRGMSMAVILVLISLLLPILVGIGASEDSSNDLNFEKWTDGYFVRLGSDIVGPWLGIWMTAAAMVTNIGMFEAEMSSDAWQVAGMAEKGILPSVLATRSEYDSPTYGILLSALGVAVLGWGDFSDVIDVLNLLYCYSQLIEFAAYIKIRMMESSKYEMLVDQEGRGEDTISHRNGTSPIRFYCPTYVMMGMLVPPVVFIFIILFFSGRGALLLSLLLAWSGFAMHYLLKYFKANKVFHFV